MFMDDTMLAATRRPPIISHLGIRRYAERPPKPTARGTAMRYSSAYGCERALGYAAVGFAPSNPMGEGDAGAAFFGTLVHEDTQEAILATFAGVEVEVPSEDANATISGSADGLISVTNFPDYVSTIGGTHILWELKTMGEYAFDKQVGFNRRSNAVREGTGPARKAIAQAGMNALNIMRERPGVVIDHLVLGSICTSPLSVAKSRAMRVDGIDRLVAEYWIPRDLWEPLAMAEVARMAQIANDVGHGYLPDRIVVDDDGETRVILDPQSHRGAPWQCDYCSYRDTCVADGPGVVRILESRGMES